MRGTNLLISVMLSGALVSAGCTVGTAYPDEHVERHHPPQPRPQEDYRPEPDEPQDAVVTTFYGDLAPQGHWVDIGGYGRCWYPSGVSRNWRPYTVGQWVYTDYGWSWDSDEPWGYATYHYGRWFEDSRYGWVWMPGSTWAPAWVAWRGGGGYVGWAPLGPSNRPGSGNRYTEVETRDIPPSRYNFVQERAITDRRVSQQVVNIQQNTTIINKTTNITNINTVNKTVVNQSLSADHVQRATGKKVERVNVREVDNAADARKPRSDGEVVAYRPKRPSEATLAKDKQPPRVEPASTKAEEEDRAKRAQAEQAKRAAEDRAARQRNNGPN